MADILHNLIINADRTNVFRAVSTPDGLNNWWTLTSSGTPEEGAEYKLGFGPEYDWQARVSRCTPNAEFELSLTRADDDWQGTRLRFILHDLPDATQLSFQH